MTSNEIIVLISIGLFAGLVSGTLGLGGGIVIIPALVFFLGLTQHQAQGTSLAILLFPIGILGVYNYYKAGFVNMKYTLVIVLAFIIGSYFGSLLSINLPEKFLRKIFGIGVFLISLRMIFGK